MPHVLARLLLACAVCGPCARPMAAGAQAAAPIQAPQAPTEGKGAAERYPPTDPFVLRTQDGRFSLRTGIQVEFRYQASDADNKPDRQTFQMRQVRPQPKGQLGLLWLTYFVQPELAGATPRLLDLELTAQPIPEVGLKIGQFLTPFSRTFYTPVPRLLFPDFSIANDAFRADRDTGAMLFGTPFKGLLEYYTGAFNGNRIDQGGNDDNKLMYVGRVAVNPLGALPYDETAQLAGPMPLRLGIGLNAYRGEVTTTKQVVPAAGGAAMNVLQPTDHNTTVGADLALHYWLATLQAEAYYRELQLGAGGSTQARGGHAHASVFIYHPYVEVAVRMSVVDPNDKTKGDVTRAYEGMLNLYAFGNNLKLNLRYTHFDNPNTPAGKALAANLVTTQVQAYF